MFEYALLLIFPAAMMFAAAMDLFTMTIPNRVSIALVAGFVLVAFFSGLPIEQLAMHVAAGALMLVLCVFMFWKKWLGGGDAKLLAAASLWVGFEQFVLYAAMVAVAGGILALLILVYRSFTLPVWMQGQEWAMRLHEKKGGIPYGIAIAAAGIWIYPTTAWFTSLAAMGA